MRRLILWVRRRGLMIFGGNGLNGQIRLLFARKPFAANPPTHSACACVLCLLFWAGVCVVRSTTGRLVPPKKVPRGALNNDMGQALLDLYSASEPPHACLPA